MYGSKGREKQREMRENGRWIGWLIDEMEKKVGLIALTKEESMYTSTQATILGVGPIRSTVCIVKRSMDEKLSKVKD
jgi:hypothetical protein